MKSLKMFAPLALLLASAAAPAMAGEAPVARLVACGKASCLVVKGQRDEATTPVSINGHQVATTGARHWRASVPVETVRAWSSPNAQSITVTVAEARHEATLPVGMLSRSLDLAMLEVRVK